MSDQNRVKHTNEKYKEDEILISYSEKYLEKYYIYSPVSCKHTIYQLEGGLAYELTRNTIIIGSDDTEGVSFEQLDKEYKMILDDENVSQELKENNVFIANYLRIIAIFYGKLYFEKYNNYYFCDIRHAIKSCMCCNPKLYTVPQDFISIYNLASKNVILTAVNNHLKTCCNINALSIYEMAIEDSTLASEIRAKLLEKPEKYGPLMTNMQVCMGIDSEGNRIIGFSAVYLAYKRMKFDEIKKEKIKCLEAKRSVYLDCVKSMLFMTDEKTIEEYDSITRMCLFEQFLASESLEVNPIIRVGIYNLIFHNNHYPSRPYIFDTFLTSDNIDNAMEIADEQVKWIKEQKQLLDKTLENN